MDWKSRQNADGGWPYRQGCSWAEPTAFALLAQLGTKPNPGSLQSAMRFLRGLQRADGGWSPQCAVSESTWITSVITLLPAEYFEARSLERAHEWLIRQTGMESGWRWKLEQRLSGNREEFPEGWPWFPGAAAWVIPTAFGILAFEKALSRKSDSRMSARVESGRRYLLAHICADGGWNHGGNKALGRDGDSYPETTGIALLALRGAEPSPALERAKDTARKHLSMCRTAEGIAWLAMGLVAHGEKANPIANPVCRTTMDYALMALAGGERNPLIA